MKTIYQLLQIANRLRQVTEVNSISPEATFGLQSDVLEYLADMEQCMETLCIKKVYTSVSAMTADGGTPVDVNGKALRFGQIVVVYDENNSSQVENGNLYVWQKGSSEIWRKIGNVRDVLGYQLQIDAMSQTLEDHARAIRDYSGDIDSLWLAIDSRDDAYDNCLDEIAGDLLRIEDLIDGIRRSLGSSQTEINRLKARVTELEGLHSSDPNNGAGNDPVPQSVWYVGQITKTKSQFGSLTVNELVAAATQYPISQKTVNITINNSCWYAMVPTDADILSAQYTDSGLISTFDESDIKSGFTSGVTHEDVVIEGKTYHVYVNRNTALVNGNVEGQFTIK